MKNDCDKGYRTDCCCNCKRQVKINCHPKNDIIGKGSILNTFGYGCDVFKGMTDGSDDNQIIFYESKHGMCEMHERIKIY